MDWSSRAQENLWHFYDELNDYNFFIEDKDPATQKIFKVLLNRMYEGSNISRVFPLKGRANVIKKSIKSQNKKNIYIVDGDLHIILNEKLAVTENTNLVVLEKYCLENYLLDEVGLLNAIDSIEYLNDIEEIKRIVDYRAWVINNKKLSDLFIAFALVHKYCNGVQTVSKRAPLYTVNGCDDVVCSNKINAEIKANIDCVNKRLGSNLGDKLFDYWKDLISKSHLSLTDICSGKDFLFLLLYPRIRMSSSVMCSIPKKNLLLLISSHVPVNSLKMLIDPYMK